MSLIQSIILGIVQGLTEFLPVSSSGHLAIFKYLFGLEDVGIFFDVLLHVGTLVAVFAVYYSDIWKLIVGAVQLIRNLLHNFVIFIRKGSRQASDEERPEVAYRKVIETPNQRFVVLIIVSSIPVAIVGFLFEDFIDRISSGLLIPGICLLITGVALLLSEAVKEGRKGIKNITWKDAVLIGLAQAFATFPGISRSGSTIATGMMCGVRKETAVKYSFIMSIPAILGAAAKSALDIIRGEARISGSVAVYIVGAVIAAIVGYAAIRLLLVVVKKRKFKYFAFYCFLVGIVAIIGFFATR